MNLNGQVALVTGSSRGIGRRIAVALARAGADIVLSARTLRPGTGDHPGSLEEAAKEIEALGVKAVQLQCDLTAGDQVQRMCRDALARCGHVDIVVNNGAYFSEDQHYAPFLQFRMENWYNYVAANLMAPVLVCRELLPQMIERKRGIIINVTSGLAYMELPMLPGQGGATVAYGMTKGGNYRFSQGLAKETGVHGIPTIMLDPGLTLTERVEKNSARLGKIDVSKAQSMEISALTAAHLCTHPNIMFYNGKVVVAADYVREHNLL
ncbi:MAG: SDR family NAD(P)-dependent oxidoreductase [Candidatus Binataceae bacterium]